MDRGSRWRTWATIRTTCVLRAESSFRTLMIRAVRQKAPMESLLRSALLVLMDNMTAEYTFITTFFSPDGNPIPVRKETPMSPSIAHDNLSSTVQDDEAGTPVGTHSATTSTSFATPVTVDTNLDPALIYSVARGATPQLAPPVQLSKEDKAALNAVWKQIADPAVEYTQVGKLFACPLLGSKPRFPHGNNSSYATVFNGLHARPLSNRAWSQFPRSYPCSL